MSEIRPPSNGRLICSGCGRETSFGVGDQLAWTEDLKPGQNREDWYAKIALLLGARFIAFCDFCCLDAGLFISLAVFGELPFDPPYVTGFKEVKFDKDYWKEYIGARQNQKEVVI